jgi:hypothetical protein
MRTSTLALLAVAAIPCPTMTVKEVWQVAGAVLASLGGGGIIVLGLSSFLGKVWANRALAKQKQDYAQLNINFTHQLELVSKQVQMELDKVGHLHKLRTESEFQKLCELWKSIARLRYAFSGLPKSRYDLQASDKEAHHQSHLKASNRFYERYVEAFELWNEEALSIPENISNKAAEMIKVANDELDSVLENRDPFDENSLAMFDGKALTDLVDRRSKRAADFTSKSIMLLESMRKHVQGNTVTLPEGWK